MAKKDMDSVKRLEIGPFTSSLTLTFILVYAAVCRLPQITCTFRHDVVTFSDKQEMDL